MLGSCKVRDYRFIGNCGIIERERTGKKPITGDAVRPSGINPAQHHE
jgi:hypothetical protein